ncbi:hypothetical protein D3C84_687570 [compost metagenome]
MGDCVDQGFEDRAQAVLRIVHTAHLLAGRDAHMQPDKIEGIPDLLIQRTVEVLGVYLFMGVVVGAAVGHSLDISRRQPFGWLSGTQQCTCDTQALDAIIVDRQMQALQLEARISFALTEEGLNQQGIGLFQGGAGDRLLVEANQPCLAALLEQSGKHIGHHLALGMRHTFEITIRAFMHHQTARHCDDDDRLQLSGVIGQFNVLGSNIQRRLNSSLANLGQPLLYGVQRCIGDAEHLPGFVVHAQDQGAALSIAHCCQLIGQAIGVRAFYFRCAAQDHALELQGGVLAEANSVQPIIDGHGCPSKS